MTHLDPTAYPPALAELLRAAPLAPLGPGQPHQEFRSRLEAIGAAFPAGISGAGRSILAAF